MNFQSILTCMEEFIYHSMVAWFVLVLTQTTCLLNHLNPRQTPIGPCFGPYQQLHVPDCSSYSNSVHIGLYSTFTERSQHMHAWEAGRVLAKQTTRWSSLFAAGRWMPLQLVMNLFRYSSIVGDDRPEIHSLIHYEDLYSAHSRLSNGAIQNGWKRF